MIVGVNYKKEGMTKTQEIDCCYYCCLGVSTQAFGSLASHRPSTLAVLVPLD